MKLIQKSLLSFAVVAAASLASFAQTADEIVNNYVKAIGGADAWKKVNTMKYTGTMNAQGMQLPLTITLAHMKGMRIDFNVMGTNNYQIFTDKDGWAFMPIQQQTEPQPMPAEMVENTKDELDIQGELLDYKSKGGKIEALGNDTLDGRKVMKLKHTSKAGKEAIMYFDAENYYLLKKTSKLRVNDNEVESTFVASDYQKQPSGIVTPMSMTSEVGLMKFTSVEVNPKLDEAIFKPSTN